MLNFQNTFEHVSDHLTVLFQFAGLYDMCKFKIDKLTYSKS